MNRTAERVLSIIAAVMTAIGTLIGFVFVAFFNVLKNDPGFRQEVKMDLLSDPQFTTEDVDMVFTIFDMLGGFIWLIIIAMIISIVLNIVGIVNIWNNKNAKLAGIMFIIAGLFAGFLSLSSILLYIAAILCFTKKPPLQEEYAATTSPYHTAPDDPSRDDDDTLRPL